MPRIDPIQLLKCLSVLLAPNGGIRSKTEVRRLADLMTKFSKKLVSKCIYIQILKSTERELLGQFMGAGGWCLVHIWLTESIITKNWALIQELLELLLLCPINIERLKSNNCPKLVKELSKEETHDAIKALASKLVGYWLKLVKDEPAPPITLADIPLIILENKLAHNEDAAFLLSDDGTSHGTVRAEEAVDSKPIKTEDLAAVIKDEMGEESHKDDKKIKEEGGVKEGIKEEHDESDEKEVEALPILKITMKNGKQVIMKVEEGEEGATKEKEKRKEMKPSIKPKHRESTTSKSSSSGKHSSSSKSSDKSKSSSSSKNSSSDKHKSKSREKEDSHRNKDRSSSHKDKSRDRDRERSSSEKRKSDSDKSRDKSKTERSSRDKKEEKSEKKMRPITEQDLKNRETLEKLIPPSINKLGKIPKKSDSSSPKDPPSISIEVRKPNDPNRPRTVKVFNSKTRSHGFEEEIKPPPSRLSVVKKPPPVIPPTISLAKRSSPPHHVDPPPEKKPKTIEKPGSIKLIPPKPKPIYLLESDMFMDALTASATNKKEPRKRKRRTSGSKDGAPGSEVTSPPTTPTSNNSTSPSGETKSTPFKFYKDTLENEEEKDESKEKQKIDSPTVAEEKIEKMQIEKEEVKPVEEVRRDANGLKSVLCFRKKKGPKKTITWKPDNELEEIQYFELDETERVNVSKTFTDMKQQERFSEREAVQKARNLTHDNMGEKTTWRRLIPVEYEGAEVEYGKNSKEKEIQANRQKSILQSLYFNKAMIPDSPAEADPETHTYTEPTVIPLEDVTGNPDSINDYRNTPWPEPKEAGPAPNQQPTSTTLPQVFPPAAVAFPPPFPNPAFGMGFPGPRMPSEWPGLPPNALMGPNMIGPGGMPMGPPVMMPTGMPDNMMPPDMFNGPPGPMFPGPPMGPDGFIPDMNGGPNMFGPGFVGPPSDVAGNFTNFRGHARGRTWRGSGGGPMRARGGRICIHFQKKGSCRTGDKCSFLHPGVNCPL